MGTDYRILRHDWTVLAEVSDDDDPNATFKLEVIGNNIKLYRNGVEKLAITDSDEPTGRVVGFGVRAFEFIDGGPIILDNFAAATI